MFSGWDSDSDKGSSDGSNGDLKDKKRTGSAAASSQASGSPKSPLLKKQKTDKESDNNNIEEDLNDIKDSDNEPIPSVPSPSSSKESKSSDESESDINNDENENDTEEEPDDDNIDNENENENQGADSLNLQVTGTVSSPDFESDGMVAPGSVDANGKVVGLGGEPVTIPSPSSDGIGQTPILGGEQVDGNEGDLAGSNPSASGSDDEFSVEIPPSPKLDLSDPVTSQQNSIKARKLQARMDQLRQERQENKAKGIAPEPDLFNNPYALRAVLKKLKIDEYVTNLKPRMYDPTRYLKAAAGPGTSSGAAKPSGGNSSSSTAAAQAAQNLKSAASSSSAAAAVNTVTGPVVSSVLQGPPNAPNGPATGGGGNVVHINLE